MVCPQRHGIGGGEERAPDTPDVQLSGRARGIFSGKNVCSAKPLGVRFILTSRPGNRAKRLHRHCRQWHPAGNDDESRGTSCVVDGDSVCKGWRANRIGEKRPFGSTSTGTQRFAGPPPTLADEVMQRTRALGDMKGFEELVDLNLCAWISMVIASTLR